MEAVKQKTLNNQNEFFSPLTLERPLLKRNRFPLMSVLGNSHPACETVIERDGLPFLVQDLHC